jgi:menaquinol-cytochrome c reductase iron-sulfur subunit
MTKPSSAAPGPPAADSERRGFLTRLGAVFVGGLVGLVPLASGLFVFLDPLRRKTAQGRAIRVATTAALPEDGTPAQFPVIADRTDAWNRYPAEPIGAVYLRKAGEKIECFSAICPHAGCFVGYNADAKQFRCPCHTSAFELDGTRIEPSPSPRNMDTLALDEKKLAEGEIWVQYQNFLTGKPEKTAK